MFLMFLTYITYSLITGIVLKTRPHSVFFPKCIKVHNVYILRRKFNYERIVGRCLHENKTKSTVIEFKKNGKKKLKKISNLTWLITEILK